MAEHLYKYRTLDGPGRLYAERLLVHNKVYLSSPRSFNDPSDSKARIVEGGTDDQHRSNLLKLYSRKRPEMTEDARRERVEEIIRSGRHRDPTIYEETTKKTQAAIDTVGVFCLAETPASLLMWAHYASSHSGFCIQLLHHDEPFLGRAQKVEYSVTYPCIVYPVDSDDAKVDKWLLTKADCWKYEAEWRVIERAGPGIYELPPDLLTGITFGSRMSEADRAQLREWALQRKPRPQLYDARPRPQEFAIDIVAIA